MIEQDNKEDSLFFRESSTQAMFVVPIECERKKLFRGISCYRFMLHVLDMDEMESTRKEKKQSSLFFLNQIITMSMFADEECLIEDKQHLHTRVNIIEDKTFPRVSTLNSGSFTFYGITNKD